MNHALRPYVTAGVALVGAGMVAVAPATAALPAGHAMPDVALTAGADLGDINLTQAWTDAFDTAKTNFTTLQTAATDASSALGDALKSADFKDLDFKQLTDAMTFLGGDQKTFLYPTAANTLDTLHQLAFLDMTYGFATPPVPALPEDLVPVVNFLASPVSASLIGEMGPGLSPMVALINSFEAISTDLSTAGGHVADMTAALQEMVNIPANMVNGMLNGATLNLDALVPAISGAGLLPAGTDITSLSFAFGGLLTPGSVASGVPVGTGADAVHVGGSIFNSLGLGISLDGTALPIGAEGVGPLAASVTLENMLTQWLSGDLPALEPATTTSGGAEAIDGLSGLLSGFDLGGL